MARTSSLGFWRHARDTEVTAVAGPAAVWGTLLLRTGLAVCLQSMVAVGFAIGGASDPWRSAADWWLAWFALASVVNLSVLQRLLRREGLRLRDLYHLGHRSSSDLKRDLAWVGVALVVAAPLGFLPNLLLAGALWAGDPVGADLTFRPLPVAGAAAILLIFPIVHALAELPTYFSYVMPRMESLTGWGWRAVVLCGLALSLQHVALPLLFDGRYLVWRALMFLPFALWFGFIIQRRPTTLPFLVVAHGLLDLTLPLSVLLISI
ncbi:MAG: hypothetical protein ACXWWU_00115 [Candidatus Limnocylindria bacterium]